MSLKETENDSWYGEVHKYSVNEYFTTKQKQTLKHTLRPGAGKLPSHSYSLLWAGGKKPRPLSYAATTGPAWVSVWRTLANGLRRQRRRESDFRARGSGPDPQTREGTAVVSSSFLRPA